ncbi:MAG: C1 family peptidase [Armatimonadota bacterium]|nr:C1 family peptidase [Armatimonadota bacterium]
MPPNTVKRGHRAAAKVRSFSQNGKPPSGVDLGAATLCDFRSDFAAEDANTASLNAVTKTSVHAVAQRRASVLAARQVFSHNVDAAKITSQKSSGRCWLFAGLNTMRMAAIQRLDVEKEFEFSQTYLMFWDKLEKANYFYESILGSVGEPIGSRLLDFLLDSPIQDGGQWDMFVNLVNKYGVVPKEVMPESQSSSSTGLMNGLVTRKLRADAQKLREMASKKATQQALRRKKKAMLSEVYRMLSIHLGEPPAEFEWQWRNKAGDFHREGIMTPHTFMEKFVGSMVADHICLIHCPQKSKKLNTLYTVEYLGNVIEGDIVKYLTVQMSDLKKAAIDMIKDGKPVWFGCDVGKMLDGDVGALDAQLYDYESIYGLAIGLDKPSRLDYGDSRMTHAMVLCGVDLDNRGKPRKWRVENSWGENGEGKGFLTMTDDWFDEFVYEVAVEISYLSETHREALMGKPIPLPPWDPMGALA